MAKEYFPTTDQFSTITTLVSAPETLAGTLWRGTIPLAGLALDGREEQAAIVSAVFASRFGGESMPADVSLRLLANAHSADYGAGFDARQTPLGSIGFEIAFGADFEGMEDVPLTFTVAGQATDGPALEEVVLPTISTNATDLTLKDVQGGALPGGYAFEALSSGGGGGEGGGDAETLEGHPAADFALASHSHPASAITDFAEAVQDAVAAALVAGSGQAITYDDASNTITFVNSAPLTTESVQDIVGAMVEAGSNVSTSYDDATGKLTIISSGGGGGGLTQEEVEDIVAALLVAGTNVTLNYNDATGELEVVAAGGGSDADTLEGYNGAHYLSTDHHTDGATNKVFTATEKTKLAGVASGATANSTDSQLKDRANHTGTQSADSITDGTTNKAFTATEKTKLAGIATSATANAKASDAEVIAGVENTRFVTSAQAKLAVETHATGGGSTGVGNQKRITLTNAPDTMEFFIEIGADADKFVFNAAMNAAQIKTGLEANPGLAGYGVEVTGESTGTPGTIEGTLEVHSYNFSGYMAMEGLGIGVNENSYYDVGGATNFSTGVVNLSAVQSGINNLAAYSSNPVTVTGTLSYNPGDDTYNGTLVLTFSVPQALSFLTKVISPMMWFVVASFTRTVTGVDEVLGVGLYNGEFEVTLSGASPFPEWSEVKNSEVHALTISSGDANNYTWNSGANFKIGATLRALQLNQRALGGDYAGVLVRGTMGNPIGGDVTSPGQFAGTPGDLTDNSDITAAGWGGATENYADFDLGAATTLTGITLDIGPFSEGYSGPDELRIYGKNTAFSGSGAGGGTMVKAFTGLSPWAMQHEKKGPLLFDSPVTYRYYRYYATDASSGVTFYTMEIEFLGVGTMEANLKAYFPASAGTVSAPSATGTGAAASVLHEFGSDSEYVTVEDRGLSELVQALTDEVAALETTLSDEVAALETALDAKRSATPETFAALTDGATITWATGGKEASNARVTLGGNRTLAITGAVEGSRGTLIVVQDGTGSRTLALPSGSKVVNGGGGAVLLSTAAAAVDMLSFVYDGTNYFWAFGPSFT